MNPPTFLPASPEEVRARGWDGIDILLVSGDAYVDHPSFGTALIGRLLEAEGFRVAIAAQPDYRSEQEIASFGRPRLFAGISAGCLDSLLARYTSHLTPRQTDAYSPGGVTGLRPDRACIVYANLVRRAFPGLPILLGGIEASLRRLAHYDYWSDRVRRSILLDARADWIAYGMAESAVRGIARRLAAGEAPQAISDVRGTVWVTGDRALLPAHAVWLPPEEEVIAGKESFAESFRRWYGQQDPRTARPVIQPSANRFVVQMPPSEPFSPEELDRVYELPFIRRAHPKYERAGGIPALTTVECSITSHRGCGGGCAFCTLAAHQGRIIQSRTPDSIAAEAERLAGQPWFRGTVTDIGGPTANMYGARCGRREGVCTRNSCLHPKKCGFFQVDGSRHLDVLGRAARTPGIKHVFVETGIRHDLVLEDPCKDYLGELCRNHVGGHLKIAPEHVSPEVLECMHKAPAETLDLFRDRFASAVKKSGPKLFLVPYFMSGHPGCTVDHMLELAEYLRKMGSFPEQVQDFVPLPMTLSAAQFWTGRDPVTGKETPSARGADKGLQRALLQPTDVNNRRRLVPLLRKVKKLHLLGERKRTDRPAGPPRAGVCAAGRGDSRMDFGTKALFYRQLAVMLKAGLPLTNALRSIATSSSGGLRRVAAGLLERVDKGGPLSTAMVDVFGQGVSAFEAAVIRAGENSGMLAEVAERLAAYFEFLVRIRGRFISGMVYPVILLHAGIFIPAIPTLLLKGLGPFLASIIIPLVLLYGGVAAVLAARRLIHSSSPAAAFWDELVISVPVAGPLARTAALLRFLQALICLYSAGVGMVEALRLAAETMGNTVMEREMLAAVPLVREGCSLSEALAHSRFLPPVVRDMIVTGEHSGRMDETLTRVTGYMQEEMDNRVDRLLTVLPVVIYLLVALWIAVIVISFWTGYAGQINSLLE